MTSLALQCVDDFSFSCLRAVMSFPPCVPNQPKPSDCCFSHCELISPRDVREQTAKRQLRPNVECVYAAIAFEHVTTASRQPSEFSTALTILLPFLRVIFRVSKMTKAASSDFPIIYSLIFFIATPHHLQYKKMKCLLPHLQPRWSQPTGLQTQIEWQGKQYTFSRLFWCQASKVMISPLLVASEKMGESENVENLFGAFRRGSNVDSKECLKDCFGT